MKEKMPDIGDPIRLTLRTYNGRRFPNAVTADRMPEYEDTNTPIVLTVDSGLRVLLGTHDTQDLGKPDVHIERQPNGWSILMTPNGADPIACVYIHDDGRMFATSDDMTQPLGRSVTLLEPAEPVPDFDAECEGCDGVGIRDHSEPSCALEIPDGWHVVERCDACDKFANDVAAAHAFYREMRTLACSHTGEHVLVREASKRPMP